VTIVAVSSNNSLCGAFNSHVIKALETTIDEYAYLGEENIQVIPIGKKVRDYARRFPNVWGAEQLVTEPLDLIRVNSVEALRMNSVEATKNRLTNLSTNPHTLQLPLL